MALGELAVVGVGGVGQSGYGAQARGVRVAPACDGDQVEGVTGRVRPRVGGGLGRDPFPRAAELFQHAHPARPESAVPQQGGDLPGGGGVGAEHQEPAALVQGGGEAGGGAADQRDDFHVLQRPAEAGTGVRDGGGVRQDTHGTGAEHLGEGAADAVEHRIAAGEDGDTATRVRGEQAGDGGPQR